MGKSAEVRGTSPPVRWRRCLQRNQCLDRLNKGPNYRHLSEKKECFSSRTLADVPLLYRGSDEVLLFYLLETHDKVLAVICYIPIGRSEAESFVDEVVKVHTTGVRSENLLTPLLRKARRPDALRSSRPINFFTRICIASREKRGQ